MSDSKLELADLLAFAIERKIVVLATYNRGEAKLAPRSLFERHGDLFLTAFRLEFDGRAPAEPKLGTFKLSGLSNVRLSGEAFPEASLRAAAP